MKKTGKNKKSVCNALLLILLLLSVAACGKTQQPDDTVREDNHAVQPDDTIQTDHSDAVSSGNTVMAGDVELTLQAVELNENIGLMRRTFVATGEWEQIEELFGNALNMSEPEQQDGKTIVTQTQTAFYKEENEIWKFSCNVHGEGAEYTFEKMATDLIEDKTFTTATDDGRQATVILTPYAAWIQTDGAWMDMADAYQFAAELTDGSEQEIAILPIARSRKAREQTLKELPYMGDGYKTGEELTDENGDAIGGRFIFYEQIALDEMTDVHIYI